MLTTALLCSQEEDKGRARPAKTNAVKKVRKLSVTARLLFSRLPDNQSCVSSQFEHLLHGYEPRHVLAGSSSAGGWRGLILRPQGCAGAMLALPALPA